MREMGRGRGGIVRRRGFAIIDGISMQRTVASGGSSSGVVEGRISRPSLPSRRVRRRRRMKRLMVSSRPLH